MSLHAPEVPKRARDDATESLIQAALAEEAAAKRAKKGLAPLPHEQKQAKKGQTLAEIEADEGGPVKESLVGMAAVQRALRRKKGGAAAADETGVPDDLTLCEEGGEEEGDGAAGAAGAGDMFADEDGQQQQGRQAVVGGRKVPKGVSAAVAAAMAGDGGFAVTGFNMAQEREEGGIDEEGNFVPAAPDDDTAKDAWLNSEEAKPVSAAVAAAAAARAAAMDAADEAPRLSDTAIAQAQREIASLLLPGESVTEGLKRLAAAAGKGKALGRREKQRLAAQAAEKAAKQQQQGAAGAGAAAGDPATAAASFARLTELADLLLSAGGEMGIYSDRKEALARFAAAVLPQSDLLAAPAGAGGDGGDDMFAEDDGGGGGGAAKGAGAGGKQQAAPPAAQAAAAPAPAAPAAPAAAQAAPPAPAAAPAAAAAPAVDYTTWPVKELRRFLAERGVDASGAVEKADLAAQVARVAAAGPAVGGGKGPSAAVAAPFGYSYDRSSGLFYNADAGLYWSPGPAGSSSSSEGRFYNPATQKWYRWDAAAGQYEEVGDAAAGAAGSGA